MTRACSGTAINPLTERKRCVERTYNTSTGEGSLASDLAFPLVSLLPTSLPNLAADHPLLGCPISHWIATAASPLSSYLYWAKTPSVCADKQRDRPTHGYRALIIQAATGGVLFFGGVGG